MQKRLIMKEIIVTINGKKRKEKAPIRLIDLVSDDKHIYICAKVNNVLQELSYVLNSDANIEFLTIKDTETSSTYKRSLIYIISDAFYHLYPNYRLLFSYSISRALYVEINNADVTINEKMKNELEKEIKRLVALDIPFSLINISRETAINVTKKYKREKMLALIKQHSDKSFDCYKCDDYFDYLFGRLAYSTGYVKDWKLHRLGRGLIIQYPRPEENGQIPKFEDAPIYFKALQNSDKWAQEMGCRFVGDINAKLIKEKNAIDFINECEARHARMLCELGETIEKNINRLRLICIAGPSSSGKTTFANRLRVELLSRGIHPTMISLDNYYLPRAKMPRDSEGNYDFECLEALNIDLFNKQMLDLTNGKTIMMPIYNFGDESKKAFKKLKQNDNKHIVIIEGIHALNEKLTSKIKRELKYKIYISPQIQVNLEENAPLSLTDFRLIRRITRDYKFRNTPAIDTIQMWPRVRAGEFKYIYKGIENADYVFNSFSFYELCAYRKYTYPLLKDIKQTEPLYPHAERLMKMLHHFIPLSDKWIPCNAIVREFIGGSCFE